MPDTKHSENTNIGRDCENEVHSTIRTSTPFYKPVTPVGGEMFRKLILTDVQVP